MSSVKSRNGSNMGPIAERLAILLDVSRPGEGIRLTYRQFAAESGGPVTGGAVKQWPQGKNFPADVARLIVVKARDRGLVGVTLEWVLWGEGSRPQKAPKQTHNRPTERQSPLAVGAEEPEAGRPVTPPEPHGRYAERITNALQADLSHNEFGQWSSVEVQHTVIWALKDLARRLYVLRFDMGKTFELTDEWAGRIGLPVRPPEGAPDERDATR